MNDEEPLTMPLVILKVFTRAHIELKPQNSAEAEPMSTDTQVVQLLLSSVHPVSDGGLRSSRMQHSVTLPRYKVKISEIGEWNLHIT